MESDAVNRRDVPTLRESRHVETLSSELVPGVLCEGSLKRIQSTIELDQAVTEGDEDTVRRLLKEFPELAEVPDSEGQVLLHKVALGKNSKLCSLVLELVGDVDPRDKNGNTPLGLVCLQKTYAERASELLYRSQMKMRSGLLRAVYLCFDGWRKINVRSAT